MRILPIILAVVVAAALYLVIIDRDATVAYLDGLRSEETGETPVQGDAETATEAADEPEALIRVVVQRSIARELDSAVVLRGQTEAMRQVDVRAETSATVISDPLRKGRFVEAGQLLCKLDPGTRQSTLAETRARLVEARASRIEAESRVPEAQARLIEARAMLAEARVNQNAASRLSEGGFASETRVKNAEAAVASAEASVEAAKSGLSAATSGIQSADASIESAAATMAAAEKELERLEILAPFAGLLESDTAELGSLLQPGSLCATILQLDPIKLVAFVPETEVNRIEVGAMTRARLAAGGDDVAGRVTFLSRSSDPETRTFRVEIAVPNDDLRLRDGQTAEIVISAEGKRAHLLPPSALTLNDEGALGLRTVDEDSAIIFRPVSIIRDTTQGVWLSGLPEEVDVVVVGQEYVTDGVRVAATYREQTQ
ncbi:MAG: efflux RND transporter periplasmic adaptor subunit [Pseudomonadota bacterium]